MKFIFYFFITTFLFGITPKNDELLILHSVTTTQMNAIVNPIEGSLIFNTDDHEVNGSETFGSPLTNNPAWLR